MTETFSQQYCTVAPCGAGGRIVTGAKMFNCLAQIEDGELTLIQAPATLIAKAPVSAIQIVTPAALRKIGTGVILKLDDKLISVAFDLVYRRQQEAGQPQASTGARIAKSFFSFGDITSAPKAIRLAKELTRDFTTALTAAGAVTPAG